jgi:hypothetical protein
MVNKTWHLVEQHGCWWAYAASFFLDAVGPQGRPWMWASGHDGQIKRAAHGYAAAREEAMAALARVSQTAA